MNTLDTVRVKVVNILLMFLWAHVPAAFVHGWWAGSPRMLLVAGVIAALATLATAAVKLSPNPQLGRLVLAACMVLTVGALVALYEGHPWQKDVHLYFATVVALLSSTFCSRTLMVASGTTVLYFLVMNFAAPTLLFGDHGTIVEAGFEVIAFLVLSGGLLWVTNLVVGLFKTVETEQELVREEADHARREGLRAEAAAAEAQAAADAAHAAREEAEALRTFQIEQEEAAALEKQAIMEGLAKEFEQSVQQIVRDVASMTAGMKQSATTLQHQARDGMESAGRISRATEDASSNVEAVSGAATELSGSTSEIAQQVDRTNKLTGDAVSQAESVAERIGILSERAKEIGSVVALITEIAEQTNLLALNATIEAARAGEVGRGFAVVATEVKNLAGESAKAAEGIHERIAAVQAATDEAVAAMNTISDVIRNVNLGAAAIAAAVEEQDAATRDIANSVRHASDGARSAAENARHVEDQARQSQNAAGEVLGSIEELEALVVALGRQTDGFLVQVRAT